jgi:hypothetical protein
MSITIVVPSTLRAAGNELRRAFLAKLEQLPKSDFLRAWCAVAYTFPSLHPDGYEEASSGWPRVLKRFAAEAWRRNNLGELRDEEMYPSEAAWAGIYDRLDNSTASENQRRAEIAARYGAVADA